jgi:hypothetical protein
VKLIVQHPFAVEDVQPELGAGHGEVLPCENERERRGGREGSREGGREEWNVCQRV